jgi:hypothetical protein
MVTQHSARQNVCVFVRQDVNTPSQIVAGEHFWLVVLKSPAIAMDRRSIEPQDTHPVDTVDRADF